MSRSALPESIAQPVESLKVPPHSIEAEQSLLGGLMLSELATRSRRARHWLDQLPGEIAENIAHKNGEALFVEAFAQKP